jgi:hypothetical protein
MGSDQPKLSCLRVAVLNRAAMSCAGLFVYRSCRFSRRGEAKTVRRHTWAVHQRMPCIFIISPILCNEVEVKMFDEDVVWKFDVTFQYLWPVTPKSVIRSLKRGMTHITFLNL